MFISDDDAIRYILLEKDRYVCYLGAGASIEAGVKLASDICIEIRNDLLEHSPLRDSQDKEEIEQWANEKLNWDKPEERYTTAIKVGYPNQDVRVQYFRRILRNVLPSFSHHAVALLMRSQYFRNTCLTTNFDKLLESAFTQQGELEVQPIRTSEESQYWQLGREKDKFYIIKLHGDYDTYNILNTPKETMFLDDALHRIAESLLQRAGLVVIGTAGNERSVQDLFARLALRTEDADRVLSFGLFWGIYMGQPKPRDISEDQLRSLLRERIDHGVVNKEIVKIVEQKHKENELFCFFPVWSSRGFMFDLVNGTNNEALIRMAETRLDHEMRLRSVFSRAGLSEDTINKHIKRLKERQKLISPNADGNSKKPDLAFRIASKSAQIEIRVMYGDITSRSLMADQEFQSSVRAVVSPEDTFISAGGGVAYLLLNKASKYSMLNELAKFSPIQQGDVAVTSGGNLPVHYIFHAAAIEVEEDEKFLFSVGLPFVSELEQEDDLSEGFRQGFTIHGISLSGDPLTITMEEAGSRWRIEDNGQVYVVSKGEALNISSELSEFLFSVGLPFLSELEQRGDLSEDFRQEFSVHGLSLSEDGPTTTTEEPGSRWRIEDSGQAYLVEKGEALNICEKDVSYVVSRDYVRQTMTTALEKASVLGVGTLWVPLMGAGVAGHEPEQSFTAILEAISRKRIDYKMTIILVIYKEKELSRDAIEQSAKQTLGSEFDVHKF